MKQLVEYDLSPAMIEGALRDKLIAMGWTPPKEDHIDKFVSCFDRMPTDDDANPNGDVVWLRSGVECLVRVSAGKPIDATLWKPLSGSKYQKEQVKETPKCLTTKRIL